MSYVSFTLSPVRAHAPAHTPPRLLLPPARKSNQHATYRRPRERIIRERWQESEGPRRDSGPLRCATTRDPLCEFLACVRKCLGGILRYCHRIFSRNPLRSCLGPWTHTRVTFIPFFVSRPLNRTPLPPRAAVDEIWPAGWHRGVGSGCGSSFISFEDRTFIIAMCDPRFALEKSKLSGDIFSSPQISLDLSESWNRIGRDFWLIFTISVHGGGSGMVEIRSLQYRIYSVRILSGRRHKRRCLFNFSLILVCSCKRISNFNCGCL